MYWYQCSSRVGVANRISATVGGVVWSWQCLCVSCVPIFYPNDICECHEDLSSCKAAIKFEEKSSCVKMDF